MFCNESTSTLTVFKRVSDEYARNVEASSEIINNLEASSEATSTLTVTAYNYKASSEANAPSFKAASTLTIVK